MSHPGPSAAEIVLSEDERAELVRRAGLPGRRQADRARIILACADGMSNGGAAQALGVAVKSVSKWRRQFAAGRLAGLNARARPWIWGRPEPKPRSYRRRFIYTL
jgi:transposase